MTVGTRIPYMHNGHVRWKVRHEQSRVSCVSLILLLFWRCERPSKSAWETIRAAGAGGREGCELRRQLTDKREFYREGVNTYRGCLRGLTTRSLSQPARFP